MSNRLLAWWPGDVNVLELFAGGGGGIWGGLLLGHTPVCAVEIVEANRRILLQRQLDGMFPRFPIWDDVRTFDGREWRGKVDIVSGGFPCQDISCAGKGAGIDGSRSGLWSEMARIIGEVRPRYAFIENSPMLVNRGLDRVLCDLAAMGFDAEWGVVGAHHAGAPHKRDRIWILANTPSERRGETRQHRPGEPEELAGGSSADADPKCVGLEDEQQGRAAPPAIDRPGNGSDPCRWPPEPGICRVVDGVANWKHRIFSLGNGQVPRVHALAWRIFGGEAR